MHKQRPALMSLMTGRGQGVMQVGGIIHKNRKVRAKERTKAKARARVKVKTKAKARGNREYRNLADSMPSGGEMVTYMYGIYRRIVSDMGSE